MSELHLSMRRTGPAYFPWTRSIKGGKVSSRPTSNKANAARLTLAMVGFDTLTLVGRSLFAVCRRLSHSGRVVPGVMSRSTEAAEGGTRDEVSLDVEDVVNGGVDGDEALG